MANLETTGYTPSEELIKLEQYKFNPSGIVNETLNRLYRILNNSIELVEPSNPFMYLLETNCLNTAFAIQEYTLLTRKLYPRLANSEKELYLHMSDFDYLGRFSEPAFADIQFNILHNDFTKHAYTDPVTGDRVFKIPRHFKISIENFIFTLSHGIIIRKAANGVIDVRYDHLLTNELFPLETNYINFDIYRVNQNETYINFVVRAPEINIEMLDLPIEKSKLFKNTINFVPERKFYAFEAFYLENNVWKRMLVTHTDEVYDINTPTVCVKVLQATNSIEYFIPPVYINTNRLTTKVRFLVYTTNGYIDVNFNDFRIADFTTEYENVFPELDLNEHTSSLQLVTKVVYIRNQVTGGKNSLSFNELKQNVINNSIGDRMLPITQNQLEFFATQNNFTLIRNVDVTTNRIFGLQVSIPQSVTQTPISRINFDQISYKTSIEELGLSGVVTNVSNNIKIIPENTIFKYEDNRLKLLNSIERNSLVSLSGLGLLEEVNRNKYLSTFYHYILDASKDTVELRAYELNTYNIDRINFKNYNSTARIGINTISSNIVRSSEGYVIDIICNYKKYLEYITFNNIDVYLAYEDVSNSIFYLKGRLYTVLNEQPIYRFNLTSNFFINSEDNINFTNFVDSNNFTTHIAIPLLSKLKLLFLSNITPDNFTPIEEERYISNSFIASGYSLVTIEELTIKFGDTLTYLYRPIHTSTGTFDYKRYTENIPLRYTEHVLNVDGTILHAQGDIVKNTLGETIYKHRINDVVLDDRGIPIPVNTLDLQRYITFTFVDYKYMIATKPLTVSYLQQVRTYLSTNITNNASVVQNDLLENTVAYVTLPKTLDNIIVKVNNLTTTTISSSQRFVFDLYVDQITHDNVELRGTLTRNIISILDNYLDKNIILRKTEILEELYVFLRNHIRNISIPMFTELNAEYIEILSKNSHISINSVLDIEADGYSVKEDVVINLIVVN